MFVSASQSLRTSHVVVSIGILLGVGGSLSAATLTVEDIFKEPRIEGARARAATLSPDEKWMAYVWNPEGQRSPLNLYVVSTRTGKSRVLTDFVDEVAEETKQEEWAELRNKFGETTTDTLDALPDYFKDETKKYRVGSIAWSPDSKAVIFTVRSDIYVAKVLKGSSSEIRRLTFTHAGESSPRWSPEGRFISFVRAGAIWLAEVGSDRRIQVIEPVGSKKSISSYRWSPSGRFISYIVQDDAGREQLLVPNYLPNQVKDEPVLKGYPNQTVHLVALDPLFDDEDSSSLYSRAEFDVKDVDLGEGKHPVVSSMVWHPAGDLFVVQDVTPDMKTRKLHLVDLDGKAQVLMMEVDPAWVDDFDWTVVSDVVLEFSPNGEQLLVSTERQGFHHLEILEINEMNGESSPPDPLTLIADLDPLHAGGSRVWIAGKSETLTQGDWVVNWAAWMTNDRIVLLHSQKSSDERHLAVLDVASHQLKDLATAPGMNTHPQLGKAKRRVVYRHSTFTSPQDYWSLDLVVSARPKQLTDTVPSTFKEVAWNVPEIVSFPSKDGETLKGLIYKPADFDPSKRYPVVVFVHGAGIMQNVKNGWTIYSPNYKFHTVLTQRGFAVFEVDYRGSLGYGRDFRAGTYMYIGGKDLEDELAGVQYLETLGWIDTNRVGIYGGSYGGFMALMALFKAPQTYAAGAALRFVSDWENYYRGNPWYCIQRLGKPEDNATAYYRSSPLHFAENLEDPLLLLHGMRDNNVHFQDAAQLTERLIRLGKRFELMVYPTERHGFTAPESWVDEYERIERFFAETLDLGETSDSLPVGSARRE